MAKKMDPNFKLVNEISKAIGVVDLAVGSDPAGLAISKRARSALNRIKSLADAIKVPTEGDAARIAHDRKIALAALASKAKATKARKKAKATKARKKAKATKAKRSKRSKSEPNGANHAAAVRRRNDAAEGLSPGSTPGARSEDMKSRGSRCD